SPVEHRNRKTSTSRGTRIERTASDHVSVAEIFNEQITGVTTGTADTLAQQESTKLLNRNCVWVICARSDYRHYQDTSILFTGGVVGWGSKRRPVQILRRRDWLPVVVIHISVRWKRTRDERVGIAVPIGVEAGVCPICYLLRSIRRICAVTGTQGESVTDGTAERKSARRGIGGFRCAFARMRFGYVQNRIT